MANRLSEVFSATRQHRSITCAKVGGWASQCSCSHGVGVSYKPNAPKTRYARCRQGTTLRSNQSLLLFAMMAFLTFEGLRWALTLTKPLQSRLLLTCSGSVESRWCMCCHGWTPGAAYRTYWRPTRALHISRLFECTVATLLAVASRCYSLSLHFLLLISFLPSFSLSRT